MNPGRRNRKKGMDIIRAGISHPITQVTAAFGKLIS
jgi:hypothetical protein